MCEYTNRLERLTYLLEQLSKGVALSTPHLVTQLDISKKIIQTDFNTYILPFVESVNYDASLKCYVSTNNFLQKQLINSKTLATMLIMKVKCSDKYAPDGLLDEVNKLFKHYTSMKEESLYAHAMVEGLDVSDDRVLLENAMTSHSIIRCVYNDKPRELYPLSIINLEGFWYLVNWDTEYDDIRRYHLKSIKEVEITDEKFSVSSNMKEILTRFEYAINAFFEPFVEPFAVELYIDAKVVKYFERMPINKRQRVMKRYDDGSIDLEVFITDYMEIIPTIQRYIPYVKVIEPVALREEIGKNIERYHYV